MKKKKNSRGFTLIELLAIIVILSAISLIVISSITSSLEKRDKKDCEEQLALAKNAAKIYFSLNSDDSSVTVDKLMEQGYFSRDSGIERVNKGATISIDKSDGTIEFTSHNKDSLCN